MSDNTNTESGVKIMNAQLENLLSYIKNPEYVVFWEPTDEELHRLGVKTKEENDEMKVFFDDNTGRYIDCYNIDFNEIKVYNLIDWLI